MEHGKKRWVWVASLLLALGLAASAQAGADWPRMVESADGVPISYEVHGAGEPTLVFVHGWSCDGRYWREQVSRFSRDHRVVVVDLAGHGHSGLGREVYSMAAFGEDVRTVVEDAGAEEVVLVGHSMGGPVSVEAAHLMRDAVVGIVGVDTFQDVGEQRKAEDVEAFLSPLREDFRSEAKIFVSQMFVGSTDAALRDWVVADMAAAPPRVAISALEQMLSPSIEGRSGEAFEGLETPVVAINADLWPTNVEGNRQHIDRFEAVILEGTDHFLHMAKPDDFNAALADVIAELGKKRPAAEE